MKTMIIAGGSGFMGGALRKYFQKKGRGVRILTREPRLPEDILWDGKTIGEWSTCLDGADVLINLSGKSVDCRYNARNKLSIRSSRIESTRILGAALQMVKTPPKLWLNASSATTYVHAETIKMTEINGIIGDDFSMNICKDWESAFFESKNPKVRKVALRAAIVLGNSGGAYPLLRRITKLGLGGHHGNGEQWVSWIHEEDFCRSVAFLIDHESCFGPYNLSAPHPIKNRELMAQLRAKYSRPFGLTQPVPLLEIGALLMGTETELLLKSRNVYPLKLEEAGFTFSYPKLNDALLAL